MEIVGFSKSVHQYGPGVPILRLLALMNQCTSTEVA